MDNETTPMNKRMTKRKKVFLLGGIALLVVAVLSVIGFVWLQNNAAAGLLKSIKNTANQQMLQLSVDIKIPQDKTKPQVQNNLTIDEAKYKKDAGLSANITGKFASDYGNMTVKSSWVVAPNRSLYVNHTSTKLESSEAGKKLMAQYHMPDGAIDKMLSRDVGRWTDVGDSSSSIGESFGVDPCVFQVTYAALADQKGSDDFLKALGDSQALTVKRKNDGYIVTVESKSRDSANNVYKDSAISKTLKKCIEKSDLETAASGLGDLLTDAELQFDIDKASDTVKKVTYIPKTGATITVTIGAATNISITIPTVTPPEQPQAGETAEQYLQSTRPFVYNHLQEISGLTKGQ